MQNEEVVVKFSMAISRKFLITFVQLTTVHSGLQAHLHILELQFLYYLPSFIQSVSSFLSYTIFVICLGFDSRLCLIVNIIKDIAVLHYNMFVFLGVG